MLWRREASIIFLIFLLVLLQVGCLPEEASSPVSTLDLESPRQTLTSMALTNAPPTSTPIPSETPSPTPYMIGKTIVPTHPSYGNQAIPTLRVSSISHEIQSGDTLHIIADEYMVSQHALIEKNKIKNPDMISVGQQLIIPAQIPDFQDNGIIILSDYEFINSVAVGDFDTQSFLSERPKSYISTYLEPTPTPAPDHAETLEITTFEVRHGWELIEQTSIQTSINPKLLLALLEFQTQSLSGTKPNKNQGGYEVASLGANYRSFARQLSWMANILNEGYYGWKENRFNQWILDDDTVVQVNSEINAGTAALQYFFSKVYGQKDWIYAVSENGFAFTWRNLFGSTELPEKADTISESWPTYALPFPKGETWFFTSGPHYGWANGTPLSALDFAPPDAAGCNQSDYWVTACADGAVLYSNNGLVLQDLDGDNNIRTGWVFVYLHIAKNGSVDRDMMLKTGDRIGRPSCEGGIANGSHVHIARRYNGEWIPIDEAHPFILSGWEAFSTGAVYDGYLVKDPFIAEAWYYKTDENQIAHK